MLFSSLLSQNDKKKPPVKKAKLSQAKQPPPKSAKKPRKSKKNEEIEDIEAGMTALRARLEAEPKDDCSLWGELAAAQLRQLSEVDRLQVQQDFNKSFTDMRMNALKRQRQTDRQKNGCFSGDFTDDE